MDSMGSGQCPMIGSMSLLENLSRKKLPELEHITLVRVVKLQNQQRAGHIRRMYSKSTPQNMLNNTTSGKSL
jgi:hypothetical protein